MLLELWRWKHKLRGADLFHRLHYGGLRAPLLGTPQQRAMRPGGQVIHPLLCILHFPRNQLQARPASQPL